MTWPDKTVMCGEWGIESGLLMVFSLFQDWHGGPPLAKAQVSFFKSLFFLYVYHKHMPTWYIDFDCGDILSSQEARPLL